MNSLQGHLLIADPHLPDANFFRSVVLMIQHTDEGASGLVLNRPSNVRLSDVWHEFSDKPICREESINIGGPVQGPLLALHNLDWLSECEIFPGIHLSMQRDNLDEIVANESGQLRLFSGYSGWGSGQLENELRVGGWLTIEAIPAHVFYDPDLLWKSVCEQIGQDILFKDSNLRMPPGDPSLN